jgi:hypothetical protein
MLTTERFDIKFTTREVSASIWEKTIFPMQNFTSVSAGRNRDNRETQVRLIVTWLNQPCPFVDARNALPRSVKR